MDSQTNTIRWGPYTQAYEPRTREYFLFRDPDPLPIRKSHNSILKESVSLFGMDALSKLDPKRTSIIKLHGDIRIPSRCILGPVRMRRGHASPRAQSAALPRRATR